jgi:hypothetical protein
VAGGPEEGKRLFLRAGRWALRTLDAEGKQVGTSEAVSIAPGGGTALRLRAGEVLELKRQAR